MKVTDVRIRRLAQEGKMRAIVSLSLYLDLCCSNRHKVNRSL